MVEITKRSAILAVILGGAAGIVAALPIDPPWRPVEVAIAAALTALAAIVKAG